MVRNEWQTTNLLQNSKFLCQNWYSLSNICMYYISHENYFIQKSQLFQNYRKMYTFTCKKLMEIQDLVTCAQASFGIDTADPKFNYMHPGFVWHRNHGPKIQLHAPRLRLASKPWTQNSITCTQASFGIETMDPKFNYMHPGFVWHRNHGPKIQLHAPRLRLASILRTRPWFAKFWISNAFLAYGAVVVRALIFYATGTFRHYLANGATGTGHVAISRKRRALLRHFVAIYVIETSFASTAVVHVAGSAQNHWTTEILENFQT